MFPALLLKPLCFYHKHPGCSDQWLWFRHMSVPGAGFKGKQSALLGAGVMRTSECVSLWSPTAILAHTLPHAHLVAKWGRTGICLLCFSDFCCNYNSLLKFPIFNWIGKLQSKGEKNSSNFSWLGCLFQFTILCSRDALLTRLEVSWFKNKEPNSAFAN